MNTDQGARFQWKEIAIELAEFLKSRNPLNEVAVKDA